jgi:hypothetical protein
MNISTQSARRKTETTSAFEVLLRNGKSIFSVGFEDSSRKQKTGSLRKKIAREHRANEFRRRDKVELQLLLND